MRSKRGGTRGKGRGGGGGRGAHSNQSGRHGPSIQADFIPFSGTTLPRSPSHGFSLQAEALNTQRHESSWSSDQRLRDTKVNFVSAGGVQPSLTRDPETAMADMSLKESVGDIKHAVEKMEAPKSEDTIRAAENFTEEMPEEAFIIDTEGTQTIKTGLPAPCIRSPSPSPSNSSEEVILFGGRDSSGKGILRPPSSRSRFTETSDLRRIIDDDVSADIEMPTSAPHTALIVGEEASFSSGNNAFKKSSSEFSLLINRTLYEGIDKSFGPRQSTSRKRRDRSRWYQARQNDDALMADYIANIKEQGLDPMSSHNRRELGGNDSDPWQDTGESSTEIQQIALDHGWSRSDLADFDNLSTSDEVMGFVQTILSKRIRQSGKQYLVVWEGCTVDEARWVPETSLTDGHVLGLIAKFEAEQTLLAEAEDFDSDSDESDSEDEDDMNIGLQSDASEDDNADLLQRKIDSMTDEKIARLLAKQEELGMDSTEIMLFDGLDDGNMDDFIISNRPSRRLQRGYHGSKRSNGEFPSATLLADAYDGFDVMDFERPSLKKKPKGRKGRLAFDLSDAELEASMHSSWDNDRLKKKERKQEREELRGLGLLGNAHNKPDLKLKYKEGMGIDAIREEIKLFLEGDNTTLSLPPMEKGDRKVVHDIANAFNLKSKSIGSGRKRFPVLHRTQRTSMYVESTFNAVMSRKNRRFLPRMDMKGKRSVTRANAGGFSAAVSYRDGDVVGGSAPELGVENRGRAMLEKMGWSSGTALGALNNKGILQPVSHVVKTTKAGLG